MAAEPSVRGDPSSLGDGPAMSLDDAIRTLRADPAFADLVQDAYLGRDVRDSAARFLTSAEWHATAEILLPWLPDAVVIDLGSGSGIAAAAFVRSGASTVYAVEPDGSDEVGRGAIARLGLGPRVTVVDAFGERLPMADGTVDIVYARQVLHHAEDLMGLIQECTRVLRPGGVLLAAREHVVDDDDQLETFLKLHPVHRLAGGEHAFRLDEYIAAIQRAGLRLVRVLDPWDSIITAFPLVRSDDELRRYAGDRMGARLGTLGRWLVRIPGVEALAWRRIRRPLPGRLYAFLAVRPGPYGPP